MKTTLPTIPAAHPGVSAFNVTGSNSTRGYRLRRHSCAAAIILFALSLNTATAQSTYSNPGAVSTLAGGTKSGSTNGTGTAALFDNPTGVASDAAGNIYVADTFNQTIRKITPAGVVSTLAGSPTLEGSTDATGSAARFFFPAGVAVDAAGNVYVADGKHTVRKITPAGAVSTLAGTAGASGSTNATGSAARFNNPEGVAVDGAGNVTVADTFNHAIRRISSAGVVTTLAGTPAATGSADGTGSVARFAYPTGMALDAAGNAYVGDTGNHTIRKITSAGVVTTLAGMAGVAGSADGTGAAARFDHPSGVGVDSNGNVYVADSYNQTIRRISPAGVVTTVAGNPKSSGLVNASGNAARFFAPIGLGLNPAGEIFVGDSTNAVIRKIVVASATVPEVVVPAPVALLSRISNVSVRTALTAGQTLIVGAVMQGGEKPVLLRAVGPTLKEYGVTNAMADPRFAVYNGGTKIEENNNWGGGATLVSMFATLGAFPLPVTSLDGALVVSMSGARTAHISGPTAGIVLFEAYDAGSGLSTRLVNVSARNLAGTGDDVLIAGFTIAGTGPKNVLIRGVGPTLAGYGVTGWLADPKIALYSGATKIGENDTWNAGLTSVFNLVGAFQLGAGSKDAALTATLNPGSYTVHVQGSDGGTGEALVEVYELP
jgi:sugar lactone lactonase YvrE